MLQLYLLKHRAAKYRPTTYISSNYVITKLRKADGVLHVKFIGKSLKHVLLAVCIICTNFIQQASVQVHHLLFSVSLITHSFLSQIHLHGAIRCWTFTSYMCFLNTKCRNKQMTLEIMFQPSKAYICIYTAIFNIKTLYFVYTYCRLLIGFV